jgi:hypothetical protein
MSTKSTIKYSSSKDFMFHLYYCVVKGYCIDIKFKDFYTIFLIDKEQAEQIERELNDTPELNSRSSDEDSLNKGYVEIIKKRLAQGTVADFISFNKDLTEKRWGKTK